MIINVDSATTHPHNATTPTGRTPGESETLNPKRESEIMGIKLNLKNGRIGWVNVFNKAPDQTNENGDLVKGKYQVTVYLSEDHDQLDQLEDAVRAALAEGGMDDDAIDKWMKRNYGFGNHADKCAVRDLAERDNPIEGLEEGLYFKATSFKKPRIVTKKGFNQVEPGLISAPGKSNDEDEIDEDDKEVYAGCYANLTLDVYWVKAHKVLCIGLGGLRFRKDGVEFKGAGMEVSDDDLSDDEDDAPRKSKSSASKRRRDSEDDEDDSSNRKSSRRRRREEDDE